MHPWQPLSCTECHGGDGTAETKELAHVKPSRPLPNDERVLPLDWDPAYLRFRNPTDLRSEPPWTRLVHSSRQWNQG